ncbi:hypothetical protein DUI87_01830 [Hirundo rustica rustica]|uniref:RNase H type-1 domain-containing protein n=1 Tax=Hirundo rustica rustica TaxID=333673 RepID=A0A3M0L6L3_HIRRU|nr:hypothetical protein DUI87_01830 [Hirundo rustica rustica]
MHFGHRLPRGGYFKDPKGFRWAFGIAAVETEGVKQLNTLPGLSENPSAVGLLKVEEQQVPIATSIVHRRQYRTTRDAVIPIHKMIRELESQGVVSKTHSPFNSPIWPVRKPDGEWRLTVDYRALNEVTPPLSAAVPDMLELQYELESKAAKWYAKICLKPPQVGYKNSPTIFGEQLAKDLESWEPPPGEGQLLQYVDDLLIATRTQETCMDWTQGIALGILAQNLGPYRRAVAYLSKQLDTAAKGWPGCLRAVAAVAINIQEARKFTLGRKMTVLVSHTMSAVLEAKGGHWLSPQRFLKYQAILVGQDDVEIVVTNSVNPASFLSGSTGEPVIHDCLETIEATYSSRPDLKDTPLEDADTWFTDGSSYVVSGRRHAGYAVTTSKEKAEIIALIRALELAKGKEINIYMDSRRNMLADREAKEAAKGEVPDKAVEAALIPDGKVSIEARNAPVPKHSTQPVTSLFFDVIYHAPDALDGLVDIFSLRRQIETAQPLKLLTTMSMEEEEVEMLVGGFNVARERISGIVVKCSQKDFDLLWSVFAITHNNKLTFNPWPSALLTVVD